MTDEETLAHLQEQAAALDKLIRGIDHDIQRMLHALAGSEDPGRMIMAVQDRINTQQGYLYDMGKVEARVEDMQNRIQERNERDQEAKLTERFTPDPDGREDHLDWLRPKLDVPQPAQDEPRDDHHRQLKAEERMMEEMHRESEDYLDWWDKRG